MDTETQKAYGDSTEIDLVEYIRVPIKKKWLILGIAVLMVAITAGFSIWQENKGPKIYQISTALETNQNAESTQHIKEKITHDIYGIAIREKLGLTENAFPPKKFDIETPENLIFINVKSEQPESAKQYLGEMIKVITEDQNQYLQSIKERRGKEIEKMRANAKNLEKERDILKGKIDALKMGGIYQSINYQLSYLDAQKELENKNLTIDNIYSKIDDLETEIDGLQSSKIIQAPRISEIPSSKSLTLNILLAGTLGLFLGVLAAYGKEWWDKNKLKIKN